MASHFEYLLTITNTLGFTSVNLQTPPSTMLFLPQSMPAINILRKEGADIATFDKNSDGTRHRARHLPPSPPRRTAPDENRQPNLQNHFAGTHGKVLHGFRILRKRPKPAFRWYDCDRRTGGAPPF